MTYAWSTMKLAAKMQAQERRQRDRERSAQPPFCPRCCDAHESHEKCAALDG